MPIIPIICKKCGKFYKLGKNALVVSAQGVLADFGKSIVIGGSSGLSSAPDLIAPLDKDWSALDQETASEQEKEINRILPSNWERTWRCNACNEVQKYRVLYPKVKDFAGATIEEVSAAVMSVIPEDRIDRMQPRDFESRTIQADGNTSKEAINNVKKLIPKEAFEIGKIRIDSEGQLGSDDIEANSENEARNVWQSLPKERAFIKEIKAVSLPKNGFLGFGKKKGIWKVAWSVPYIAKVSFKLPIVVLSVTYYEPY